MIRRRTPITLGFVILALWLTAAAVHDLAQPALAPLWPLFGWMFP